MVHIADYIRYRARQLNLTIKELSKKSGLSKETIYQLQEVPTKLPELRTIMRLADALEIHPLDLLQRIWDEYPCYPSESLLAGIGDRSAFVDDITIPDGMVCMPNQKLTKIWRIQNIGDQVWKNRSLICVDGYDDYVIVKPVTKRPQIRRIQPVHEMIAIPEIGIGEAVDLKVDIQAPDAPGRYLSYWKMYDEHGQMCFPNSTGLSIQVRVVDFAHSAVYNPDLNLADLKRIKF